MDRNKKAFLLLWLSKVWGKPMGSLSDLQNGDFFLHVLKCISDWKQDSNEIDKLTAVKSFLQDFYGEDSVNDALDFDAIFSNDVVKKEMELTKVAVVLLGLAVIDKQGDIVKKATMELPAHFHADVVSVLKAVTQPNGQKFVLSDHIEEALLSSSDDSTESNRTPVMRTSTPFVQNRILAKTDTSHNASFGISSPLREMSLNSGASPLVTFIQSPQLVRKAILKEKELELRNLRSQLNEQVLLKEDIHLTLREQMEENARKDSKIIDLIHRIKDLQALQDARDELDELKPKFVELEAKCDKLTHWQQRCEQYKGECQILEKETKNQRDEIQTLHHEVLSLKSHCQEKTEKLKTKSSLEKQLELIKVQLEESSRLKALMEEELVTAKGNLMVTEEKYRDLKRVTEESNDESFQGESMGVIVDMQLGEMRSKMDEFVQERDDLQGEISNLKSSLAEQSTVVSEMKKQLESSHQTNQSLITQLREKSADIETLKRENAESELEMKNSMNSMTEKHDVAIKRLYAAAEKVSLEKDSVIKEMKELERQIDILNEKHRVDFNVMKVEGEEQLLSQRESLEQEMAKLKDQMEKQRNVLISDHEKQLQDVQEINDQKVLLEKEEGEIQVMKVKEKMQLEMKSKKSAFEVHIAELNEINERMQRHEKALEQEIVNVRNEMSGSLCLEKEKNEDELKKLQEGYEKKSLDEKNNLEKEIAILQASHKSQITLLEKELQSLQQNNAATLERLQKDHGSVVEDFEERLSSASHHYEEEVKNLKNKLLDAEGENVKLVENLEEGYAKKSLDEKNNHKKEIAILQERHKSQMTLLEKDLQSLQQNNAATLERLQKDHGSVVEDFEERLSSASHHYEEEVKTLKNKLLDAEGENVQLVENLAQLEERMMSQLTEQKEKHVNVLSIVQQENNTKLLQMEEGWKEARVCLEADVRDKLSKQTVEYESIISSLRKENSDIECQKLSVEEAVAVLSNEKSEMCSQISIMQKEKDDVMCEKCALEEKVKSLEIECHEVLSGKEMLEKEVKCLHEEKSELLSVRVMLEERVKALDEEKSVLVDVKSSLEDEVTRLKQETSGKTDQLTVLDEKWKSLQHENSEIIAAGEAVEVNLIQLKEEYSQVTSQVSALEEQVVNLEKQNSEIVSQKMVADNEIQCLQKRLHDTSSQNTEIDSKLKSAAVEHSDLLSQKLFVEEKLACLRQENFEALSQKTNLEEKTLSLEEELCKKKSEIVNIEAMLTCKDKAYSEVISEKAMLEENLSMLQKETSTTVKSMREELELAMNQLKGENEEKIVALIEKHEVEKAKFEEQKDELMKEISNMKEPLESAWEQIKKLTVQLSDGENTIVEQKEHHQELMVKMQSELSERLASEKAEFEHVIVARMDKEAEEKLSVIRLEHNQSFVKMKEEAAEMLLHEREEHKHILVKLQEEASDKIAAKEEEFEKRLTKMEEEHYEKSVFEKEEHDNLVETLREEMNAREELVVKLEEEAAEKLNCHELEITKLKDELAVFNSERKVLNDQITMLQSEAAAMMQLQKVEHERDMDSLKADSEAKVLELSAQYCKEMEQEVTKAREEVKISYEANLDELKLQFEAAKESEITALLEQKAEFLAVKEQYEETETQRCKLGQRVTDLQEENNKLRERETILLRNTEAQMTTANEFHNNLRKQLEEANSRLEAQSGAVERIQDLEQQFSKVKGINTNLNNALIIEKETSGKMSKRLEAHVAKHDKTKAMMENSQKECRIYAIENNRLKTSLDYAERKLKSYKDQLEQVGNVTLGSDVHFRRIIEENEAEMDDSLDKGNTSVASLYSLRSTMSTRSTSSKSSVDSNAGSPNETIISADSVMMRRETLAGSSDLKKKALPPGYRPTMQSCANEPEDFEWGRLSELQRRNTLCLPHMKSSYPVETQVAKKEMGSDETLRQSLMPGESTFTAVKNGKRRSPRLSMHQLDDDDTGGSSSKREKNDTSEGTTIYFPLARDGAVYQQPGPVSTKSMDRQKVIASGIARKKLTPSKLTKSPAKLAKSPGKLATKGRSFKSPGLKMKSQTPTRNADVENRASVAFSVGITPKKSGIRRVGKRSLQNVSKLVSDDKTTDSPKKKVRRPFASRNYRETGL